MQQSSCEEIQLLISRYVDDEVTTEERELVEGHVATCEACSYRLLQWVEMAAIFAESPMRMPNPELRTGLFREIRGQKQEGHRKEERVSVEPLIWRAPEDVPTLPLPIPFPRKLLRAASPLMAAVVSAFFLLGALVLRGGWAPEAPNDSPTTIEAVVPPIPTRDAPLSGPGVPPPVDTRGPGLYMPSPDASTTTYMSATATLGPYTLLALRQPTPVREEGNANGKTDWHTVRDAMYGYRVAYPPNWWTQTLENTRYFYPWSPGGTKYAPYWIDLKVDRNVQGLTADNANYALCNGECKSVAGPDGTTVWLHRTVEDDRNSYHDGYLFDREYIYRLRLSVPQNSVAGMGTLEERSAEGESVFGTMSGRLILVGEQVKGESAYGIVLFLKGSDPDVGSDLYRTMLDGPGGIRLTWDGGVKNYALSPALDKVAYAATDKGYARDTWAKHIYLATFGRDGLLEASQLLVSSMESIHDLAWYSDRELVFLAESAAGSLGLYKLRVPSSGSSADGSHWVEPELLVTLPNHLVGARSLAVSPDRQLITFLAPLGEKKSTDIYAVRPDGTDLHVIVSHASPIAPLKDGLPVLAPESQAIKSYVWMDGHLEPGGYAAKILFTCGNSYSPNFVPGGSIYSAPRDSLSPLIDPFDLVNYEPERLQITHLAYSSSGKIAFTGYYSDFAGRPDKLDGLWVADISSGTLGAPTRLPKPQEYNGITDLQWSPDGESLFYRETITLGNVPTARYNGEPTFRMVKLDLATEQTTVLYDSVR